MEYFFTIRNADGSLASDIKYKSAVKCYFDRANYNQIACREGYGDNQRPLSVSIHKGQAYCVGYEINDDGQYPS